MVLYGNGTPRLLVLRENHTANQLTPSITRCIESKRNVFFKNSRAYYIGVLTPVQKSEYGIPVFIITDK